MHNDVRNELLDKIYEYAKEDVRAEVVSEILNVKEDRIKSEILAHELYDKIDYETAEKYLKKSLPLRIRLFNKVKIYGKSLSENQITYTYVFNDESYHYNFKYTPSLYDMKDWK